MNEIWIRREDHAIKDKKRKNDHLCLSSLQVHYEAKVQGSLE